MNAIKKSARSAIDVGKKAAGRNTERLNEGHMTVAVISAGGRALRWTHVAANGNIMLQV